MTLRTITAAITVGLVASCAAAQEQVVAEPDWPQVLSEAQPKGVSEQGGVVTITGTSPAGSRHVLWVLEGPDVTRPGYAVVGQVRAEGVVGKAYLETLNHFGPQAAFSRTVMEDGPMKHITGDERWRDFSIPFILPESDPAAPDKLELALKLPATGTVELRDVQLVQSTGLQLPGKARAATNAWWSSRSAAIVGGGGGAFLGLLGGLIGAMAGLGTAKRVVQVALAFMLCLCGISLIIGLVAVIMDQPYAVYYPLLLMGFIGVVLPLALWRTVMNRYEQAEMQRLNAMDAG